MADLAGRTVLLTGASSGIGAHTAKVLGERGASVVAHYGHDRGGAERATAGMSENQRMLVGTDLRQRGAADRLWSEALAWRGRVDTLICNAAVMPQASVHASDEQWDDAWEIALSVNAVEPARLMRRAVQHFLVQGGGVVVVVSSWAAQRGASSDELTAYAATKAALAAAAKTLARAYARSGISIYLVAPGVVQTELSVRSAQQQGGEQAVTDSLAMGEWVPPAEAAELIAELAAGRYRHLTGATLDLNGASYVR